MSYDQKCLDLAEHFLPSQAKDTGLTGRLAQHIQDAVEGFLQDGGAACVVHEPGKEVFHLPECIFNYCPTEDLCRNGGCLCKRN